MVAVMYCMDGSRRDGVYFDRFTVLEDGQIAAPLAFVDPDG